MLKRQRPSSPSPSTLDDAPAPLLPVDFDAHPPKRRRVLAPILDSRWRYSTSHPHAHALTENEKKEIHLGSDEEGLHSSEVAELTDSEDEDPPGSDYLAVNSILQDLHRERLLYGGVVREHSGPPPIRNNITIGSNSKSDVPPPGMVPTLANAILDAQDTASSSRTPNPKPASETVAHQKQLPLSVPTTKNGAITTDSAPAESDRVRERYEEVNR
jgi:hypothetical protein